MKASVFIGTSLDGFIARTTGDLDFLPPGGGEPHGYDEFMATVDVLVIGRKTFETVLTFDTWPYGEKPVVVLSTRPLAPAPLGAVVERMSGTPAEIVSQLAARGIRHIYVDGVDPIWWTSFQRGIRCPDRWPTHRSDVRVDSSPMSSKPARCASCSTMGRRSAPLPAIST